jgi:hypothetical protein
LFVASPMLRAQHASRSAVVACQRLCLVSQTGRTVPACFVDSASAASSWGATAQAAQVQVHAVINIL